MHLVRKDTAPTYQAPGHADMAMRYLQGREAGPTDSVWIGLSTVAPGGGTTLTASPLEKFYVVIDGELEITAIVDGRTEVRTLGPLDSCRIAPGEGRQLSNRSDRPAAVLLVMPETR